MPNLTLVVLTYKIHWSGLLFLRVAGKVQRWRIKKFNIQGAVLSHKLDNIFSMSNTILN